MTPLNGTATTFPQKSSSSSSGSTLQQQQEEIKPKAIVHPTIPRLLPRNLGFHQCHNKLSVVATSHVPKADKNSFHHLKWLNWFHVVLRWPPWYSVSLLLITWTSIVLLFAGIYVGLDTMNSKLDCGLGPPGIPIAWGTSFAFSLETCTTVGYGLPGSSNAFFEARCPSVQVAIFAQMTWSMMFNAFLFSFFFASLSKAENRSYQVVFSNKVVISIHAQQQQQSQSQNNINNNTTTTNETNHDTTSTSLPIRDEDVKIQLKAQFYDLDAANPIVECHVRIYVMDKTTNFQLHLLRPSLPNDELGGMVYPSLPTTTTHFIDHHSALCPLKHRMRPLIINNQGMTLRSIDSATASREEIECPICGETYGTYERWRNHVRYNQMVEKKENFPLETSHGGLNPNMELPKPPTISELKQHFQEQMSEIIVVVEGIDPQTSGTFQAVQSYRYEDIAWECDYVPCLSMDNHRNVFVVDMEKFHQVQPNHHPNNNQKIQNNNNNRNNNNVEEKQQGDDDNGDSPSRIDPDVEQPAAVVEET